MFALIFSDLALKQFSSKWRYIFKLCSIILFTLLASNNSFSQITVTQNSNDSILSQMLVGAGVTISNVTKNCNNSASGTFTTNGTNLGIQQGIVLATGKVTSIPQAANSFASTSLTGNGDAQLSTLTTGTIYDPCILEFDLVPQGDTLSFKYVFGSEEYPEFVCSQFNDVFGFFITGPNPAGGNFTNKNMALVPNSTMPVCINSVNPGTSGTYNGTTWNSNGCMSLSNTGYYVNNLTPTINPNIVYDGMTTVLDAVSTVVPCQKYHLKIAISDVGDRLYDSGVFLQAYSVSSTSYTTTVTSKINDPAYTTAYEGCMGGTFTVSISSAQTIPVTIALTISGTATNGADYNVLPTSVIIPAGQTSVTLPLTAIQDNITESAETVIVSVLNQCTGAVLTSATITIMDDPARTLTVADSTLCLGQSTQLTATGGYSYLWTPATGLSSSTISNPIATPTTTTTYHVTITLGTCVYTLAQTVYVSNPAVSLTLAPSDTVCMGTSVQFTASTADVVTPYKYLWSNGNTTTSITSALSGTYSVTGTDGYGCTALASHNIVELNPFATATPTNIACFGNSTGSISLTTTAGIAPYTYNWSNSSSSASLSNVAAGNYSVTSTDAKGCTATATATVTQPATALTPVATVLSNVSCFAGNNGAINLAVTGGTTAYIYNWAGAETTQNRTNLSAGNYLVTVTDSKGCTATASATITQPSAILSATAAGTNVSCYGGNNGSVNLIVSGGTTSYSYNWGGGVVTQNRTNLVAGTYVVTITDANGCSTTASSTITQPAAALNTTATPNNVSCFGGNTGSIGLSVTGGTTAYTYAWSNGSTAANVSGLAAGNYNVTVTDAKGCSVTSLSVITQPTAALSLSATTTNVSCFAANNGSIDLSVTGGTPAYTYSWTGGVTTQDRANLAADTYNVIVTDSKGCSATTSASISQPASALSAITTATNISCFGGNTGSIILTVTGGTTAYSYNWGGGIITQNRSNLSAGTYVVTVTDANGCSTTASSTITQPAAVLNTTATPNNVSCFGGHNGSINLTTTGGTTPYFYSWNDGATIPDIANLAPGTYTVDVTDAKGCSVTSSSVITQPAAALSLSTTAANVSCFAANNGSIDLSVTGGTPAYTYSWTGGVTTQDRANLAAGTYNVIVTDSKGCSATTSASITQPAAALAATATATNINCFGGNTGSIILTVTGGTTAYAYNWGAGIITQNRNNLSAGTYSVTITDANGCSTTASSTITQPAAALNTTATPNNVSCFGGNTGSIGLSVTGGTTAYTYAWSNGSTAANVSGLAAGNYNVTVTDAKGCSVTSLSVITQPTAALSLSATTTNVSCFAANNGSIDLSVTGGTPAYTYSWTGGVTTQDRANLAAGTYNVIVTDSKGCSATTSASISQPASALSAITTATNISCFGGNTGSIILTVTGGTTAYSYNWGGGIITQNRNNLSAGTYTVTITDANGCSTTASSTITQPAAALSATATPNAVSCFGGNSGSIGLAVAGGTTAYSYAWSNGATSENISNLIAGTYNATVTDAKGCSVTTSSVITQPTAALSLSTTAANVSCFAANNGSIDLSVTGGTPAYTYSWTGGVTTQDRANLAAGTYNVIVTDSKGCSATTSASITQPAAALAATATATNINCFGGNTGSIILSVTGGTTAYTFNWGGGIITQNRSNLSAGTYVVTVTDANGCSTTASSTITQPAAVLNTTATPNNVSCFGGHNGSINLTTTGGTTPYFYSWNDGATIPDIANLAPGTYTVDVTDAKGCSVTSSSVITQPAAALSLSTTAANVSCFAANNGSIDLSVTGGTPAYTYSWTGGVTTQDRANLAAGTYNVIVTDSKGCSATTSASITQPAAALAATATATNINCFGGNTGSIILTVTGGTTSYAYNWGGGVITQNRNNLSEGTYAVTITDANGCSTTASSTITQPAAALSATATPNAVSCFGGNTGSIGLTVTGGTSTYSYAWSNGSTSQNIANLITGTYTVDVTDAKGCSVTSSSVITQPAAALNLSTAATNVSCFAANNGSIDLSVTGGTPAYTYSWTGGVTTQDRTNLAAGTYNVIVTDSKGCSATTSASITQPAAALSATTTATNINCFGGNSGSIILTVTGGTTAYAYNWGGGIITQNRNNLSAGTYAVTITDANGCSITASSTITQPAAALSATATPNEVACFGGNTGSIGLTVTGGTTAYSYAWSNGSTIANISNLIAGTYTVDVTDAKGCSVTSSSVITQPAAALSLSTTAANVSCFAANNGSIDLSVTGGTPAYTYSWTGGVITQDRTNLAAGTYNVIVTDSKGCSATTSVSITQPAAALSATTTATNINCFGGNSGSIILTVTGGTTAYAYNWGGGIITQNRNNLSAGTYVVTITDANGCSTTSSSTITQPAALSATATPNAVACFGGNTGSIGLTVTGGTTAYTYAWSNGPTAANVSGLAAGNYNVTVTDTKGCSVTSLSVITQPAAALSLSTTAANVSCFAANNGSIDLSVTGGTPAYTYSWTGGVTTQDRTNLAAGTYNVIVTDSKGCSATTSASITQPAAALSATTTATNINCFGGNTGSIILTVTGGTTAYAYNWGAGIITQNRNNLSAGTYSVTITDANGCSTTASSTITQPIAALSATVTPNAVSCFGGNSGSIGLTVAGGTTAYTYAWSNGSTTQTLSNVTAGNYVVSVNDANACSVTASVSVAQPATALNITLSPEPVNCFGASTGTIDLTVTGGVPAYIYHWSDSSLLSDRDDLVAGTYTLTLTDANGCSITGSTTVTQPAAALSALLNPGSVSCFGGNNGSLQFQIQGGTSPYSYLWNDGASSINRINLVAGNYVITVLDANSCSIIDSAIVAQPANPVTASATITNVKCFGGSNGNITLQAAGGTAPYIYNWGGGITTPAHGGLSAGIYMVSITDVNGCSITVSDTVGQPATAVNVSLVSNSIVCYGEGNGIITVSVTGGVAPYQYSWNDGANVLDRDSLLPGNYVLTVTDANSCSVAVSSHISQPAQALKALAAVTNVTCNAGNNGAINLMVSGGTPPYTFKWDSGSTNQNRAQLRAGDYQVTVTDANGCELVKPNSVLQPVILSVSLTATPATCFNGRNGSIILAASGGTPGYGYNWGNGIVSQNRNQLTAGSYSVSLTDANACVVSASATVSQPLSALSVNAIVGNVSCNGGNNGSIQLNATGGTAPYAFVWNGGDTAQNRTGLSAGSYPVAITDNQGCGVSTSPTVTQPSNSLNVSSTPTNVNCFNENTGVLDITVTGGTSPYKFSWSNGQTSQNLSNLSAGNYVVSVNDANGCSIQATATVSQPASAINASATPVNVACFGSANGSIHLSISGGTAPYNYLWSNGSTSQNIQNIISGTYHVTVTDSKSCNAVVISSVSQPVSAVSATITPTGASCFGGNNGSLTLQATGGAAPYSYNWGGGVASQNRSGLSAGHYTVTVTDANSCSITASATVAQPAAAVAISSVVSAVSCNGGNNGTINISANGGTAPYSYNWGGSISAQNRTGLSAGNYVVTVTDAKGCLAIGHDTVNQPQHALSISSNIATGVSCYNGSNGDVQLNVTGGTAPYTYRWTGGVTTENRTNLSAGTYNVTVTDNQGCTLTSSDVITQPASALSITDQIANVKCYGGNTGAININVSGGTSPYQYNWGGGVVTENRSNLAAGNYTVTVTDNKGCVTSFMATVTQAASGITATDVVTNISCYGGSNGVIQLNVTGGISPYTYSWTGGINTENRNNLSAGSYSVIITDANGCTTKKNAAVTAPDSISLQIVQTDPTCFGAKNGKIQVTATGGTPNYGFNWSNGAGTQQILNIDAGNYSVTVTDFNACTASRSGIAISQPTQLNATTLVIKGSCAGDNNGQLSANGIGGTSPYQYVWSNSMPGATISHLAPGNYVVTVTDANQCTQVANGVINDLPAVEGNGTANALPCQKAKGEILFNVTSGTEPYTFKWSDGDTTEDEYNVQPGTYSVTVNDANGCSFDTTFTVENLNSFSIQASGGGTIVLGGSGEVHVTSTGSSETVYSWTPGGSLNCSTCANSAAQPVETTTYTVIGIDTNGCAASDTVSVIVIDDHSIFTPNAFTPNGDGNNDYFQIFGNLGGINSMDVKIFNRWGEKVFESEEPTFKWDGTYKGVLQNPGVFVYEMKIVFLDGRSDDLKKGSITLIR